MILVDTAVWIDHLRAPDPAVEELLTAGSVLIHPSVIGELAMGSFRNRDEIMATVVALPRATVASDEEVLRFVSEHRLFGRGIGYIDAHLLASVKLTDGSRLWTRDRRLAEITASMGVAYGSVTLRTH